MNVLEWLNAPQTLEAGIKRWRRWWSASQHCPKASLLKRMPLFQFLSLSLSLSLTLFMRKPLSSSSLASDTKIGRRRHLRFNRMLPFENSAPFCSLAVEDINYSFVHNLKKVSAPLLNRPQHTQPPTRHSRQGSEGGDRCYIPQYSTRSIFPLHLWEAVA